MLGCFTDRPEDEEDERDGCPHCDIMMMFVMYKSQGWGSEEIVESITQGLAGIIATAPDEHKVELIVFVRDYLPTMVAGETEHVVMAQAKNHTHH